MANRRVDSALYNALDRSDPPASLEEIQSIVDADHGASTRYVLVENRQTPLFRACLCEFARIDVIFYLIEQWPQSVHMPDVNGDLPIHASCLYGLDFAIVKKLVSHFPESVGKQASDSETPLHLAARPLCSNSGPSLELVNFLYQRYPDAIQVRNDAGFLPIHHAVLSSDNSGERDQMIRFLAKASPRSLLAGDNDGDLPLHIACGCGLSLSAVQFLVELEPQSLTRRNHNGDLPLNFALLDKESPLEKLDYLLGMHQNFNDPAILHRCYQKNSSGSPLVVQYLIQRFPLCVKVQDEHGRIPLHKATQMHVWERHDAVIKHAHVQALVGAYPRGLFVRANNDKTPLEALLNQQYAYLEETRELMEEKLRDILTVSLKGIAEKFNVPEEVLVLSVVQYVV
ncbi:Ankyrin Repeat [Seminavis robusta]|uniref:Ankyrin Repeat n=1 Tax=Seminavis robusta TaxID=568900 RepID=A0A9N8F4D9_9STRA|nr:Ankyrin Repeat [Seminavis robusta]|eukprot:Sro2935_g340530.1 Ankyrin Repeat (399) ;mRNA; f:1354-2550